MVENYGGYRQPAQGAALWRYMDLAGFLSLLSSSSLFLRRADKFEDRLEGTTPSLNAVLREDNDPEKVHYFDRAVQSIRDDIKYFEAMVNYPDRESILERKRSELEEFVLRSKDDEARRRHTEEVIANREKAKLAEQKSIAENLPYELNDPASIHQEVRKHTYVSCWYMNERESAVMWRSYADVKLGIAIKTSYVNLVSQLKIDERVFIPGVVDYINFKEQSLDEFNYTIRFFTKDQGFADESEFRFIHRHNTIQKGGRYIVAKPISESGIVVKVNLAELIEAIYIAPYAEKWFQEVVTDVLRKYKLEGLLRRSELGREPYL